MVSDRRDRGQLLLVGAVAIAFIILGVVVVFNGVLYTQTISGGGTTAETRDVATTEHEIERAAACLLAHDGDNNDFEEFADEYRDSRAESGSVLVEVTVESSQNNEAELRIKYDLSDVTYERELTVEDDCPDDEQEAGS